MTDRREFPNYDWVTSEMFGRKLAEILNESPPGNLLSVPGVYEALVEHFNNDVLEALGSEREEDES